MPVGCGPVLTLAMCIFCQIATGSLRAHTVYQDRYALGFLDKSPLQFGHVLLIPKQHIVTLADLQDAEIGVFFAAAQRLSVAVERAMEAEGTFLAINNKVSQSVPHLHIHIVPRRKGDGLKGFFWPRKKYPSGEEMAVTAARIIANL
jgi:histidine triad (HIT) family protein